MDRDGYLIFVKNFHGPRRRRVLNNICEPIRKPSVAAADTVAARCTTTDRRVVGVGERGGTQTVKFVLVINSPIE